MACKKKLWVNHLICQCSSCCCAQPLRGGVAHIQITSKMWHKGTFSWWWRKHCGWRKDSVMLYHLCGKGNSSLVQVSSITHSTLMLWPCHLLNYMSHHLPCTSWAHAKGFKTLSMKLCPQNFICRTMSLKLYLWHFVLCPPDFCPENSVHVGLSREFGDVHAHALIHTPTAWDCWLSSSTYLGRWKLSWGGRTLKGYVFLMATCHPISNLE